MEKIVAQERKHGHSILLCMALKQIWLTIQILTIHLRKKIKYKNKLKVWGEEKRSYQILEIKFPLL